MTSAMPGADRWFREGMEKYIESRRRHLSPVTIKDYRYAIGRNYRILRDLGVWEGPSKVDETQIYALMQAIPGKPGYRKQEIIIFGRYLEFHGNPIVRRLGIRWPHIDTPNARWLTEEEQTRLILEAEGRELLVLHCGLDLCMRRIEMMRLRFEDFEQGVIRVCGKGQGGGKVRTIPQHPDTPRFLQLAREIDHFDKGPIFTNIHHPGQRGKPLKRSAMDLILKILGSRAGVKVSFHDLRRTGGRSLYFMGQVNIEVISMILGHEDTRTTLRYLGINLADMAEAFKRTAVAKGISTIQSPSRD